MTQKEKINVAELLKDCPTGMELDCTMYDSVTLLNVNDREDITFPIKVLREDGNYIALTKYGQYTYADFAKCVIFPKGKTTWEGFVPPGKFKDGDVVATNSGCFIGIIEIKNNIQVGTYCAIDYKDDFKVNPDYVFGRIATEEEKAKLFKAIKDNGYKWNSETKTFEKVIEPKFKVGDIIQDITGICKVKITEVNVEDKCYLYKSLNINGIGSITFNRQDDWKLVPTKFDITTLKPFDKVLVRGGDGQKWTHDFFGFLDKDKGLPFVCVGYYVSQCIPFEGNEHLLGTTDDCKEYYKIWE